MRRDRTKSILSVIATLASVVLILIYWLAPAGEASHPLYRLFIDCIPDSLVVLITIPIVYWLLYTRGLTNMGDCPLFSQHSHTALGDRRSRHHHKSADFTDPRPAETAADPPQANRKRDALVVVADADGPDPANIVTPLNATVQIAESREMLVIFARCYPSQEHSAAMHGRAGKRTGHGKARGPKLLRGVYIPRDSIAFDFYVQPQPTSCPSVSIAALDMVLSSERIGRVYVAGCARQSCIQAVCQSSLKHGKRTIALENAIARPAGDATQVESMWQDLTMQGLQREACLDAVG